MKLFLPLAIGLFLAAPSSAAPRRARKAKAAAPAPEIPVVPLHPPRVSTEPITFVWPPEGMTLAAENELILGNVAESTAHFTINGATISVHKDGGFLAYLPIAPGTFTFHAELTLSSGVVTADRHLFVPPAPAPLPDDKLAIDPASLLPKGDLELRAGDVWSVRMKATRGKTARVRVGDGPWRPLRESNPKLGIYEGTFQVQPGELIGPAPVEYQISAGWSSEKLKGTAKVAAPARFPLVATVKQTSNGFAYVRADPGSGFLLFPPAGARMAATGRSGDSIRVELSPSLTGWIEAKDVDLSTTTNLPHGETGNISVAETATGATVRFPLGDRLPYEVVESDSLDSLTVRVFGASGHTNIIAHDGGSDFVDFVRWRQEATGVVAYSIKLRPGRRIWGWNAKYDNGTGLRVEIRRPPKVLAARRPLEGWKIMLDPGHMPSASGATGPLGTKEMDANYAIAEAAAELLKKEGALPTLTRGTTTDEVSLPARPKLAVERGADVFVSVHNNAFPDGVNPFVGPRGFTIFYYHPHSLALGRAMHAAYAKAALVPDEGLQWDDLFVARLSAVPAILVENAYMTFPEQEAMLNDPVFRSKLASNLVAGLRAFALEAGERK